MSEKCSVSPGKLLIVALGLLPAAIGGMVGISTMAVGIVPAILLLRREVFSAVLPFWRAALPSPQV